MDLNNRENGAFLVCILTIITISQIHLGRSMFPVDRDVADITGVSFPKTWMVFMERRVLVRVLFHARNRGLPLTDFLAFLSLKYPSQPFCLKKDRGACIIAFKRPNILVYHIPFHTNRRDVVFIYVHRGFHINGTVRAFVYESPWFMNDIRERLMIININSRNHRFSGTHKPWSFFKSHYSLPMKLIKLRFHKIILEYNIIDKDIFGGYVQSAGLIHSYTVGQFNVNYIHIRVNETARVAFDILPCLTCGCVVYDGPNEMFPSIMKLEQGSNVTAPAKATASTFQVLIVTIEGKIKAATNVSYTDVYHLNIITLTEYVNKIITFNNNTQCESHSPAARSCVFEISSSNPTNYHISIQKLFFQGVYNGSEFAAGLIVLNEHRERIYAFHKDIYFMDTYEMNFTITGNRLYLVMFAYSAFGYFTVNVTVSITDCRGYFVDKSYAPFTGHLTQRGDKYFTLHPSVKTLIDRGQCVNIQFLHICSGHMQFIIEAKSPVKATLFSRFLSGWKTYWHDQIMGTFHRTQLVNLWNQYMLNELLISAANWGIITCSTYFYYGMTLRGIPCRASYSMLGLNYLQQGNGVSLNLCSNYYLICVPPASSESDIKLETNIRKQAPHIKMNTTLQIQFHPYNHEGIFMTDESITLHIFSNITFKTPDSWYMWIRLPICLRKHPVQISRHVIFGQKYSLSDIWDDYTAYAHLQKTAIDELFSKPKLEWKNHRYTLLRHKTPVSWNEAAIGCHMKGQYMLTLNDASEYQFIEEEVMSHFTTLKVYLGMIWNVSFLVRIDNALQWYDMSHRMCTVYCKWRYTGSRYLRWFIMSWPTFNDLDQG